MNEEICPSALQGTGGDLGAVFRVSLKNNRCAAGLALAGLRRRGSRLDIRRWPAGHGQSDFGSWATALFGEDYRQTEAERSLG